MLSLKSELSIVDTDCCGMENTVNNIVPSKSVPKAHEQHSPLITLTRVWASGFSGRYDPLKNPTVTIKTWLGPTFL